jgi:hypothetical protein
MDSDMQRLDYTQVAPALTIAIGLMSAYNRMAISFRTTPQAAL